MTHFKELIQRLFKLKPATQTNNANGKDSKAKTLITRFTKDEDTIMFI
ncbi:hypothetical protein [Winogradskyella schleiferi]|nr:hypothetical protein [Winogradskyella schleiferi]